MFQIILFFALFVAYTFSAPAEEKINVEKIEKIEDIPQQYRDLISEDVATQLKTLNGEEKLVLKEVLEVYANYKNVDEFLKALIKKDKSLMRQISLLRVYINGKVLDLGREARAFVRKVGHTFNEVDAKLHFGQEPSLEDIKKKAKEHIGEFDKLSNCAKEDLRTTYPILISVFTSEKTRAMFDKPVTN